MLAQIYFADDSWDPPVQLIHKLKLLGEDGQPSKRAVGLSPDSIQNTHLSYVVYRISNNYTAQWLHTHSQLYFNCLHGTLTTT